MIPRRWGRALALALAAVLACLLAPAGVAQGMERVDPTRSNDVTISYALDGTATPGVQVRLYQVATLAPQDGTAEDLYTLAPDFTAAGVSVDTSQTDAEWGKDATALAGYVATKGLKPAASATSDKDGRVSFSGVESGIYLVVSDPSKAQKADGDTYQIQPTLCALPSLEEDGTWSYATTLKPKFNKTPHTTSKRSFSVVKHWSGDGTGSARPKSIKVAIVHDGKTQSVQTLDASNDWCYKWEAADDGSTWTVSEVDVPKGYSVSLTSTQGKGKTSFVLTNKSTTKTPPSTPGGGTPHSPTQPASGTFAKTGDTTSWGSVVALAAAGVVAIVASLLVRTKKDRG